MDSDLSADGETPRSDPGLEAHLETPLPPSLPVGRGTAVFCFGTCFHRHEAVRGIEIRVDGVPHRVTAARMPRLDLFRYIHPALTPEEEARMQDDPLSADDPEARSFRSGFWATVPIAALDRPGSIELRLDVRLQDGQRVSAPLGRIEVTEPRQAPVYGPLPGRSGRGLIAVCMATFDPQIELFRTQVESLRAQTDSDWICLISDDCSRPERFEAMKQEVGEDPRFVVSRSGMQRGFYRNFQRALEMVPADAEFVALCDQDDRWYPEKLATLREAIGSAQLVYSDQRLVDTGGRVIAETYWTSRRNNHTNLLSLLIANTVTGAASLFRREVAELALPFPNPPGQQYHDHWIGLVAMATGKVAYLDRPLYDYVQHRSAALGHAAANAGFTPGKRGGWRRLRGWRDSFSDWHSAYFNGYQRLEVLAQVLLVRCSDRLTARKRRALRRFVASARSPLGIVWMALRPRLRKLIGCSETLGVEKLLVRGLMWRYILGIRAARLERPDGHLEHDATLPPVPMPGQAHGNAATADLQRRIAPLELAVVEGEPERVNLLIPTIELKHLFGGYIAKFNLARKLVEAGLPVRLVTVDPTPALPRNWRQQVESYSGLAGALENVEVAFAREQGGPLEFSPRDRFIATTWWTALHAHQAVELTDRSRFLYLIQEYEPLTFVMGSWAAVAMSSYELPHQALFSTELLRAFFAERGYGVFAAGRKEGERRSLSFQNAITEVDPPSVEELAGRSSKRLLFYARPAHHTARNMFELGLMSLVSAVEQGVFGPEWEFTAIGGVGDGDIHLTDSTRLTLLSRKSQGSYAELLPSYDLGLSLMLTPHPSLVPIEMASAGLVTVTSSFETKTAEAMESISSNLLAVQPSPDGVIGGLRSAVARVDDHRARVDGAAVDWSRDWEQSFNESVMRRIVSLLGDC